MDEKITNIIEQQHSEGGVGYKQVQAKQASTDSNGRKAASIQAYLNAHPEFSSEERKQYETKIRQFTSSSVNGTVGINIDHTRALLQAIQHFQEVVDDDWKRVVGQWQDLKDCWRDSQYDRFEPSFEQLCNAYNLCARQCEQYVEFLENRIHASEAAVTI
jgi:archaellum component FlaC